MRRFLLVLIALLALAVAGCLARRPAQVVIGLPVAPPATTQAPGKAPGASGWGTLELAIRWPVEPAPGIRIATIPTTTRAIAVSVTKDGKSWADPVLFTREAGPGTSVPARLRLREGSNLAVLVRAYRDAAPADLVEGILAQAGTTVNIVSAQTTAATASLVPNFVPSITSFSTNIAPVGDSIAITGSNLDAIEGTQPRVTFAGTPATEVKSLGSTMLQVKIPEGARTGPVVVVNDAIPSTPDEDIFWVPIALGLGASKARWDPSSGDRRILIVSTPLDLLPNPDFGMDVSRYGRWPREAQYCFGLPGSEPCVATSSAGTVQAGMHVFQAGNAVATASIHARIGSLASYNSLELSVEDVVQAYMDPDFAILSPQGVSSVAMRSVEVLSSGTRIYSSDLVSGDTGRVSVDPTPGPGATPGSGGNVRVASGLAADGFVLISARNPLLASRKATASVAAVVGDGSRPLVGTFSGSAVLEVR